MGRSRLCRTCLPADDGRNPLLSPASGGGAFGLCLGGGAEIALHAASRQPHAELYMGLVETGVGVVPGGGGTKEMVLRAVDSAAAILSAAGRDAAARLAGSTEYFDALKRNFELIGLAKVSTSAADARLLGYLSPSDRITAHRDRVLHDARQAAMTLAGAGYSAPAPRELPAAGESALATLKLGVHLMRQADYISDHDQKVASHVAQSYAEGHSSRHSHGGTMLSRSRAPGIPLALRRAQNPGAHCLHPKDRQTAQELGATYEKRVQVGARIYAGGGAL